jgi:hypothetical protein
MVPGDDEIRTESLSLILWLNFHLIHERQAEHHLRGVLVPVMLLMKTQWEKLIDWENVRRLCHP